MIKVVKIQLIYSIIKIIIHLLKTFLDYLFLKCRKIRVRNTIVEKCLKHYAKPYLLQDHIQ